MISLNARLLYQVSAWRAKKDVRHYLQGVNIETGPNGQGVVMTATDGHRLLTAHDRTGTFEGSKPLVLRFDLPGFEVALKKAAKEDQAVVYIHYVNLQIIPRPDKDGAGDVSYINPPNSTVALNGTFPDWRLAVPKASDIEKGKGSPLPVINAGLLDGLERFDIKGYNAVRLIGTMKPEDSVGPVIVSLPSYPNVLGLIMPMRHDGAFNGLPAFISQPTVASQAAA